jgi:hypothetical protein
MMNPETNRFEAVHPKDAEYEKQVAELVSEHNRRMRVMEGYFVRDDGSSVPENYPVFSVCEEFRLNGYRFKVKEIKPDEITFEPIGPMLKTIQDYRSKKSNGRSQKKVKSWSQGNR